MPVRCNLEDVDAEHLTGSDVVIHAAAYVTGATKIDPHQLCVAKLIGAKRNRSIRAMSEGAA